VSSGGSTTESADTALGSAFGDLLRAVRGEMRAGDGGDAVAGMLARHALIAPVTGCAVCVLDGESVRVAGVAGETGEVTAGSLWDLAGSPVSAALAGTAPQLGLEPAASSLGRAMSPDATSGLTALPLRIGEHGAGEPTSLGALLVVRERGMTFSEAESEFLEGFASLLALAVLQAAPAQDWARRTRRLRRHVDAAVDLAGSLDAEEIIPRVLERVCETLDAGRAMLLRVDGACVVAEGVHDQVVPATLEGQWPLAEQPLLVDAMRSTDVIVRDAGGDALVSGLAPPPDFRHTMVLPLRLGEATAGFLVVHRRAPCPFIHDDAGELQQLGTVALLALRNSRLYAESRAASEAMSSFLNLVVHDLRAPLAVLSGYVSLLRDGSFGETPQRWERPMSLIADKVQETHRLVDEVLLAARLDSGAVPTTIERLDLNEVAKRAATRIEGRAVLASARIETELAPAAVPVLGDPFHVDRIVDNLLNNAINYGGESPRIVLSVDASSPPALRVVDNGAGISRNMHERVFERFVRLDSRVPGTGFGLHVGRVLAEACGGSLSLERSVPGEGSVFRLQLRSATDAVEPPPT
jgi:signal transduction histidine kinase